MSTKTFSASLKKLQTVPKHRYNWRRRGSSTLLSQETDDTSTLSTGDREMGVVDSRIVDAYQKDFELWAGIITSVKYDKSDTSTSFPYPYPDPPVMLVADRFSALKEIWKDETKYSSSITAKNNHWAYQEIIGMGWPILPLLLREVSLCPDFWFSALRKITGANPVPPESRGKLDAMASAWLQWAQKNGISW
jgi:hypothetical protein